eukprot:augustus_masked-scaffold_8-processed-gene-8.6-mRNA-1 protein AED:0.56 eAED:0.57 QI:0/0/0/1/1/1/2/0/184
MGKGTNLHDDAKVANALIHVVPTDGPFDKANPDHPDVKVTALEISSIKPILDKHNVRLVGIGLGYNSLDGFVEGNYWRGNELYVDEEKSLYKALKLGNGKLTDLFDSQVKENKKKAAHVDGNMSGDGMQMGGTYVIEKGGKILYEFQQKKWGDHPEVEDLLKALGIDLKELENRLETPKPEKKE